MKSLHKETKDQLKTEIRIFQVLAVLFTIICMLEAAHIIYLKVQHSNLQEDHAEARIELDYYKHTFKERVGTVYDEYGNPETIRVVSIDGGKNWLVTSRSREVQGQRYLSIAYPNVNPDSLQEVQ